MNAREALHVRILTELAEVRGLAHDWEDLWMRCRHATPFQRLKWLLPWIEAFEPQHLRVLEVRRGCKLVGLAPMFAYRRGGEQVLAPVGAGISDYLDWLIDAQSERDVLEAILVHLEREASWDRIDLPDLSGRSPLLQFLSAEDGSKSVVHDACPVLRLPSSIEELPKVVPADQLRHLRKARRRIQGKGNTRVEVATPQTLGEFLEGLFQLHSRRWRERGTLGVVTDQRVQNFLRLAAAALLQQGVLRLYGLRFEGRLIACLYALAERDAVYCYLQGFDPFYAEFSPGMQMLGAVIEDAVRQGKCYVDLLRGRETYKYKWGAKDELTYRATLTRQTLASGESPLRSAA